MRNQLEDTLNRIVQAFFLAMFFLFVSSFSGTPVQKTSEAIHTELIFCMHSASLQADLTDVAHVPVYHTSLLTSFDKLSIRLYSSLLRIFSDNSIYRQREISLQQAQFLAKPLVFHRFYYRLFSIDSGELPA
jgi:hypothetical protein